MLSQFNPCNHQQQQLPYIYTVTKHSHSTIPSFPPTPHSTTTTHDYFNNAISSQFTTNNNNNNYNLNNYNNSDNNYNNSDSNNNLNFPLSPPPLSTSTSTSSSPVIHHATPPPTLASVTAGLYSPPPISSVPSQSLHALSLPSPAILPSFSSFMIPSPMTPSLTRRPSAESFFNSAPQPVKVPSSPSFPPSPQRKSSTTTQYARILKRRESRAKFDALKQARLENGQGYLHEVRHKQAMKRPRGPGGRFLSATEIAALEKQQQD
ncbi:Transcriptional activator [Chytridiales sp. JEL 0842]|nr:Transcriptional activator [Chytridiales sp. JEL 0842]